MTTISAEIILDSIGADAPRLTTMKLRYPRFIHAELMTHRVFSRNARSSRAVPIAAMIREIETDPVIPLHWGAAQKGMQADNECEERVYVEYPGDVGYNFVNREEAWLSARDAAVAHARAFMEAGYAKQLVNRLLEPFMHIDVLVTATEYENWFKLRDHNMAEPHIQVLAQVMKAAMDGSEPHELKPHHWHLPYVDEATMEEVRIKMFPNEWAHVQRMISAARCARISYKPFDADTCDIHADLKLAKSLSTSGHWSPFEHQAQADMKFSLTGKWQARRDHGNLVGWRQHRKLFDGESGVARRAA